MNTAILLHEKSNVRKDSKISDLKDLLVRARESQREKEPHKDNRYRPEIWNDNGPIRKFLISCKNRLFCL